MKNKKNEIKNKKNEIKNILYILINLYIYNIMLKKSQKSQKPSSKIPKKTSPIKIQTSPIIPATPNRVLRQRPQTPHTPHTPHPTSSPKKEKQIRVLLQKKFRDDMYENMWEYMNEDTIKNLLDYAGILYKKVGGKREYNINYLTKDDINDDDFTDKDYKSSIVFKGEPEPDMTDPYSEGGHYVYVDSDGVVYGTYEDDILISLDDDGICHGYALLNAFIKKGAYPQQPITRYPRINGTAYARKFFDKDLRQDQKYNKNRDDQIINYIIIFNFYKYIIEKGWWLKTLNIYFPPEKDKEPKDIRTIQTQKALDMINDKITFLYSLLKTQPVLITPKVIKRKQKSQKLVSVTPLRSSSRLHKSVT
jgi:hypothetical protein